MSGEEDLTGDEFEARKQSNDRSKHGYELLLTEERIMMARSSEQPQQLVPIDEVLAAVGFDHAPAVIANRGFAGDVVPFWDGRDALPFDIAAKLTSDIRAEQERLREADIEHEAKRLADLDETVAARRRRAAAEAGRDRRLRWGVEASAPGDEKDWSKAGAGFSEEDE